MKRTLALVGLALFGCAGESVPTRHYIVGESASLCFPDDARMAEAILRRDAIRNVTPLYASYSSHGSVTSRLVGAAIELNSSSDLTRGRLENVIDCHRQALARGAAVPANDPYAGDARVTVEQGERGSLIVKLTTPAMDEAHAVLEHASAIIGRPPPVASR
jgi:hypothetical protein